MEMHTHHIINCRVRRGHLCVTVAGPRQTEESGALRCGRHVAGQQPCYSNVYFTRVYGRASVFMVRSSAYAGPSECCSIRATHNASQLLLFVPEMQPEAGFHH